MPACGRSLRPNIAFGLQYYVQQHYVFGYRVWTIFICLALLKHLNRTTPLILNAYFNREPSV
jgi:hypothetical protein